MHSEKISKPILLEFSYLRAIGICLVVLGHSFPFIDEINNPIYKYIHSLIYSFHMPLFIMISGFFAHKIISIKSVKEYKIFIYNKFSRLMIPYFIISFLTIPIKLILNNFSERAIVLSEVLKDIFLYPWNNPIIFFWFIYVLFIIFLISPIILRFKKSLILILSVILHIIPKPYLQFMGITSVFNYFIFFVLGIYLRDFYMINREKFLNINVNFKVYVLAILIPIMVFFLNLNFNSSNENIFLMCISNILYLGKSILGIYICFISSVSIHRMKNSKFIRDLLKLISYYSFDIYLLSWFPQIFCRIILYQVFNFNYSLVVVISVICGFTPIIISKFILRKSKFCKRLLLGIT